MRSFFRFISVLLLILFIFLFPISLLMRNVGQVLFDPATTRVLIEKQLEGDRLSDAIQEAARSLLSSQSEAEDDSNALLEKGFAALSEEDWQSITTLVAPTELVLRTSDQIVTSIVEWIDSEDDLPDLSLELAPWKRNVVQNGEEIVTVILSALPACTLEEVGTQLFEGLTGEGDLSAAIPACRPGEPLFSTVIENSGSFVSSFTERMPDQIDLSQLPIDGLDQLEQVKLVLIQTRSLLSWPWMLLLGLAILAVLMASRNLEDLLRWSGWPALLAGIATLIIASSLSVILGPVISFIASNIFQGNALPIEGLLSSLLELLGESLGNPLFAQGGILLAVGIILLIATRFSKEKRIN